MCQIWSWSADQFMVSMAYKWIGGQHKTQRVLKNVKKKKMKNN